MSTADGGRIKIRLDKLTKQFPGQARTRRRRASRWRSPRARS